MAMLPGEIAGAAAGAKYGAGSGALGGAAVGSVVPGAGTAAGAATGGLLGAGAGGFGGAVAGRVASVPMAYALADSIAQRSGVPLDPSRNQRGENIVGMGVEAVLPVVGSKIAKQVAKRIPGSEAYKLAKEAGEKELVALSKQSQEVVRAADTLESSGLLQKINGDEVGVPGANVSLMLHQVAPDSPKAQSLLRQVADAPQLINAETRQAEAYGESLRNTLKDIASRGNPGPIAPENLASTVTNAVESIEKLEGQSIGKFRAKALAALGNKKQPLPPEVSNSVIATMKELGFQPRRQVLTSVTRPGSLEGIASRGMTAGNKIERTAWTPPKDLQPIIGRLGLDEGQTRSVVNILNEYGQLISRGNEARLTDVERMIKRMGPLNQKLRGSALSGTWGKMTGDLRQFRREVIGNALGDAGEKQTFNAVMDDFSMIRQNTEQLSNVLRGDVTAKTVVNGFFKGKENLANIRALKAITGNDSPQWGALKEEFVNQLLTKHAADSKTGFNSKGLLDDMQKNYGPDFIREVLDDGKAGPNFETVKNLLTVGTRIEQSARKIKADLADDKTKQGLMNIAMGLAADIRFKTVNGVTALLGGASGKEHALFEIMSRDGIERYVAGYPKKLSPANQSRITQNLKDMLAQYKVYRRADAGAKAAGRVARPVIRQDMQEGQ